MAKYRRPTYDHQTGQFEVGTGMDGPIYWRLRTPGVGVENGLIAGPADIGKTTFLTVVIMEALSSTVFHCGVADPLNRNGLAELFVKGTIRVATTRTQLDFGGRRDLLLALSKENTAIFNREQLDEVLRLRDRD